MANVDENNNTEEIIPLPGLEKLAAKFHIVQNKKNGSATIKRTEDLHQKLIVKYAPMPAGPNKKRQQRSSCSQWPWANKNKSSIPIGDEQSEQKSKDAESHLSTPRKCIKYPWSHQHKSKALDFSSYGHSPFDDEKHHLKSQYKTDFVLNSDPESLDNINNNEQLHYGKSSPNNCNLDKRSLSGTNIRVGIGKTKGSIEPEEHQKRWTSKILEKQQIPVDARKLEEKETEDELLLVSELNIHDALERLRQQKKAAEIKKMWKPSGPF